MLARQNLQVFSDTIEKADGDLEYAVLKLYPDDIKGVDAQAVLQKYIQPDPKKEGGKAALLKEDSKEAKPPPAKAPAPAAKDS